MSSHTASKHEDKTKEELLELVMDLEADVERLELEVLDADTPCISDYSDMEIRDEYEERNIGAVAEEVEALFHAFYLRKDAEALEIARRIATKHTGRIL